MENTPFNSDNNDDSETQSIFSPSPIKFHQRKSILTHGAKRILQISDEEEEEENGREERRITISKKTNL